MINIIVNTRVAIKLGEGVALQQTKFFLQQKLRPANESSAHMVCDSNLELILPLAGLPSAQGTLRSDSKIEQHLKELRLVTASPFHSRAVHAR
jgi:hypothetical protein